MPDAVARLREIGVEPRGLPFRGIRYLDGEVVAEGRLPARGPGRAAARAPRGAGPPGGGGGGRPALGGKAEGLAGGGIATDLGTFAARWIVGADGLRSQVRAWAGLDGGRGPLRRFGVRRHFALAPWSDFVEVYWGPDCEAYVTPVAPETRSGSPCSGAVARPASTTSWAFPTLSARIAGAPVASRDRGTGPLRQRARAVHRGRVALVGDAAGYLDAITGEGLAVALHESAALVEAIQAGDLGRYAAAHRRINRLPNAMTGAVLALERRPGLRRRAIQALAAEPAIFSRLLGIHARTLPARDLGVDGALRLAWRLVAA